MVLNRFDYTYFLSHHIFDPNMKGRDLVVGDIHGCFELLKNALDRIDFDPEKDRLFGVGDLVDRGPDSIQALEWLKKPWFTSVIGNHDLSLILKRLKVDIADTYLSEMILDEDRWAQNCSVETRCKLIDQLESLPIAITLQSTSGYVGLVHAQLPWRYRRWCEFTKSIDDKALPIADFCAALCGRHFVLHHSPSRVEENYRVLDLEALIHGHGIPQTRRCFTISNRFFIETGAFLDNTFGGGGFTIIDIERVGFPYYFPSGG